MKKRIYSFIILLLTAINTYAQEMTIDTTDAAYQLGKKIGSWIPVTVILFLAILFIRHTYRFKGK